MLPIAKQEQRPCWRCFLETQVPVMQVRIAGGSGDCKVVLAKLSAELLLLEDEEVPRQ